MTMPELILEAGRTEQNDWRRRWRDRELFYFLAWRDILVRYTQTVIGIGFLPVDLFGDVFLGNLGEQSEG
jgi:lipopolysaccharide transport system permease protein